jgi:hypothetical protein
VRDRRSLVIIALSAVVAVLGGVYAFTHRDGEGSGWVMPAAAILILIALGGISAGASRNKRVVRDEEERQDG